MNALVTILWRTRLKRYYGYLSSHQITHRLINLILITYVLWLTRSAIRYIAAFAEVLGVSVCWLRKKYIGFFRLVVLTKPRKTPSPGALENLSRMFSIAFHQFSTPSLENLTLKADVSFTCCETPTRIIIIHAWGNRTS